MERKREGKCRKDADRMRKYRSGSKNAGVVLHTCIFFGISYADRRTAQVLSENLCGPAGLHVYGKSTDSPPPIRIFLERKEYTVAVMTETKR